MTDDQIIHVLQVNRDANLNRPKFVEACNRAITAITENIPLKNRCFVLTKGELCMFCRMKFRYTYGNPMEEGEQDE